MNNYPPGSSVYFFARDMTENRLFIRGNVFENNSATALTLYQPYVVLHENFFEYSEHHYSVHIKHDPSHWYTINYASFVLNATRNYWGTTNATLIADSIHDNEDDDTLMTIDFWPYLLGRDVTGNISEIHAPVESTTVMEADTTQQATVTVQSTTIQTLPAADITVCTLGTIF